MSESDPFRDADYWLFWALMAVYVVAMFGTGYLASHYSEKVGYLLLPVTAFVFAFENATLAATILEGPDLPDVVHEIRFAVFSFIAPIMIVTQFELNYEVHKARSANFFLCITFDQGHRKRYGLASQLSRYSIWVTALFLAIFTIIGSSTHISDVDRFQETYRFTNKKLRLPGTGSRTDDADFSAFIDFIVPLALFATSFLTGISFWRYGTTISTDVRATICNPWASLALASVLYLCALIFTPESMEGPYLVNSAEFLLYVALIISAVLGDQNFKMLKQWDSQFIQSLGDYFVPEVVRGNSQTATTQTQLRYQPQGLSPSNARQQNDPEEQTFVYENTTGKRTSGHTPFATPRRPTIFTHPTSMPIAPGRKPQQHPPQREKKPSPPRRTRPQRNNDDTSGSSVATIYGSDD